MDINEISMELQKFADAHNLGIDVQTVLNTMDAGDFVSINTAMDNGDKRQIMQILQKYKAQLSESYSAFGMYSTFYNSDKIISEVRSMGYDDLKGHLRSTAGTEGLTLQEMRTLVYEDITTSLPAQVTQQVAQQNTQDGQQNPVVQAKLKQQSIQQNAGNQNFKVSVPGVNGTSSVQSVVGVDSASTPDKSLVVTQDTSKPGQVQVFPMNSVSTVNEEDENEECTSMVQNAEYPEEDFIVLGAEPEMDSTEQEIEQQEELELSQEEIVLGIIALCKKLGSL